MKITAVIMAGGKGERFWPKSRTSYPKQFLSLTSDGETMIQKTVKRLLPIVSMEDIFIVTNENYVSLINEQLPEIPQENILAEPVARNTAPCIALAASVISKKYDDAVTLIRSSVRQRWHRRARTLLPSASHRPILKQDTATSSS